MQASHRRKPRLAGGAEANGFAVTSDGGIAVTSDGGFAVVGLTYSKGAGNADMYVVRFDSAFNVLWDKTYGNGLNDIAYQVVAEPEGGRITLTGMEQNPL